MKVQYTAIMIGVGIALLSFAVIVIVVLIAENLRDDDSERDE